MTNTPDPDELIELTSYDHEFIAQLLVNRLEEEGIEARIFSLAGEQLGLLSASTAPHNGAQVRVRSRDYDQASEVLRAFETEHTDIALDEDKFGSGSDVDDDASEAS